MPERNETVIVFRRGGTNGVMSGSTLVAPVYGSPTMPTISSPSGWAPSASTMLNAAPWVNKTTKQVWVDGTIINPILVGGTNVEVSKFFIDTSGSVTGIQNAVYQEVSFSNTAFECVVYVSTLSEAQSAYTNCGTGRSSSSDCYAGLPQTGYPGILFIFPGDNPCPTFVPLNIGSDPSYGKITPSNLTSTTTEIVDVGAAISATNSTEEFTFQAVNSWIRLRGENSSTAGSDVLKIAHSLQNASVVGTYGTDDPSAGASSFTYPRLTIDRAGHVTVASNETYTLPYYWNVIKTLNDSGATALIGTTSQITPGTHGDSVMFKAHNKWISLSAVEGTSGTTPANQDRIDIAHVLAPANTAGTYGTIVKVPQVTVDAAGHIIGVSELGIDYYQKIYVENNASGTAVSTDAATYIEADDNDSFKIKGYNKWIVVKAKSPTGVDDGLISISHKLSSVSSSAGTSFGTTTKVPKVTFDEAGHISAIEEVNIAFPSVPDTKNVVTNSDSGTSDVTTAITNGNLRFNHVQGTSAKSSHILKGEGDSEVYKDANDAKVKFHSKPYELRVSDTATTIPVTDKETIENGDYIKLAKQDKSGSWSLADEKRINIDVASKPEIHVDANDVINASNNDTGNSDYNGTYYKSAHLRIKRNKMDDITLVWENNPNAAEYSYTSSSTPKVGDTIAKLSTTTNEELYYDIITSVNTQLGTLIVRSSSQLAGACELRNDDYIKVRHEERQTVSTNVYEGSMVYFRKATDSSNPASNEDVLVMNIVMIDGGEF